MVAGAWRRGTEPSVRGGDLVLSRARDLAVLVVLEDHLEDATRVVLAVHVREAEPELVERIRVEAEARVLVEHLPIAARGALVFLAREIEVADAEHVCTELGAKLLPERLGLARLWRVGVARLE